ncbi:hypothetical protein AURDEDRAFT_177103 [Auricularia subglabra TFB-10046 SS5]|uniref:Uncharacterized protein n=1 Tax=Auricularia subglabra (strain TFB-10046 / SS5) TaxID=717982 RepID=J0CU16_AURST|nr:hypothetical protein AURDEDRAFT_177103 [Auricularia subglabra TFB-10046 SS5]
MSLPVPTPTPSTRDEPVGVVEPARVVDMFDSSDDDDIATRVAQGPLTASAGVDVGALIHDRDAALEVGLLDPFMRVDAEQHTAKVFAELAQSQAKVRKMTAKIQTIKDSCECPLCFDTCWVTADVTDVEVAAPNVNLPVTGDVPVIVPVAASVPVDAAAAPIAYLDVPAIVPVAFDGPVDATAAAPNANLPVAGDIMVIVPVDSAAAPIAYLDVPATGPVAFEGPVAAAAAAPNANLPVAGGVTVVVPVASSSPVDPAI